MTIALLHQGSGFFAVDKPPGQLVIPGRNGGAGPSLRERLEAQLDRKVYVVHRLDRDTSGVLLFALEPESHRALSMAFERGLVAKKYLALVKGQLGAEREIDLALVPARKGRMRPSRPGEEGKPAKTRVRPVEIFADATLLEAEPLSGRTHQIRVHLAAVGHPLLYDHQYGRDEPVSERELGGSSDAVVLARTPLHASELALPSLSGIEAVTIRAPLAADIARALELLRQGSA